MSDQPVPSAQTPRPTPSAAMPPGQATRRATGTATVTVACNLPQGVWMQIYDIEESTSFLPNGREVKENVATVNLEHGQYHIRGVVDKNALAAIGTGDVLPDDYRVVRGRGKGVPGGGYALTYGVPKWFAEEWMRQNARSPLVTGHHVFISDTESRAVGQAREFAAEFRSGFEGLNPDGDGRVPNGASQVRKFSRNDNEATPDAADEPGGSA